MYTQKGMRKRVLKKKPERVRKNEEKIKRVNPEGGRLWKLKARRKINKERTGVA